MKTAVDNLGIQTRRPQNITSIYLALCLKAILNARDHNAEFSFILKVKQSRKRLGVAQNVPGSLGSQIS
jgi:hypothetical protein